MPINNKANNLEVTVGDIHLTRIKKPVIVFFFAPGCVWCEKMKPDWEEFKNNSPINYSEVSMEEIMDYKPSPKEESVRGFPTVRLYNKGKLVKEYDGDRSHKDILKFVKKYAKQKKSKSNSLMLVRARKGNNISKKLLNKIAKNRKKTKSKKRKSNKSN